MKTPRVVAIIQARMGSSRLPGKVMLDISGKPMLQWVTERVGQAALVNEVMIATTRDGADDAIADFGNRHDISVFRGSTFDVLDRYYQAALLAKADVIVRVTADCPLIDPQEIDILIQEFMVRKVDFAANRLPPPWHRTFPIGLDVEIVSFSALERAWIEADAPYLREHVMPYFYEVENRFSMYYHNTHPDYGELRWTVDTPEDLDVIRLIFENLPDKEHFTWRDVLALVQSHPELGAINADIKHKQYDDVDDRAHDAEQSK